MNIAVPSGPSKDDAIHIYDFSRARCIDVAARTHNGSRLPVIDNIPTYSEIESDWEMRYICFLMDHNHSRAAELSKFVMDFSSLAAAAEQRRRDMENGAKIGMAYGFGGIRQRSPLYDEYRDPDTGEYRVVDKRLEWQWTKTEAYQIEQKMIATYVQAVKRGDKHMVKTADRSLRDMRIHLKGRMRPDGLDRLRIPISEEFVKEGEHPWFQWPTTLTARDLDIDESALTVEAMNVPMDFARRLKLLTRDSQQHDTSAGRCRQMNMDGELPSLPNMSAEQDSKPTISTPTEESSMEGIDSDPELGDFDVKTVGSNFFDDDELIEFKPQIEARERTPMPSAQAYAAILPITDDSTVDASHTAHPSSSACEETLDEKKARLQVLGKKAMEAAQDVQRVAAITKHAEGTANPEELTALLAEVKEMIDKDGSSSDEVDDLLAASMELASSSATATDESPGSSSSPIAVPPPARSAQFASSASAFGLGSSRSSAPSSLKRKDPPTSTDDIDARPSRRARRPNAFDTPQDSSIMPSIDASASNTPLVSETPAAQSAPTSESFASASSLSERDLAKFHDEMERDPELKAKFETFLRREESTSSDIGGTTAVPSRASTPCADPSELKAREAIKALPRIITACTTQAPCWDEQKDGLSVGFLPTSKPDCNVYSYKHYETPDNPYSRHSPRWRLEEPQKPVDAKGVVYYPDKEIGSTCWLAKIDAVGRTDVEGFQLRQGEPVHKVFDTLLRGTASASSPGTTETPLTDPSPTLINLPLDQVHATAWDDQFPRIPPLNKDGTAMPLPGAKFSFDLDEYEDPEVDSPKEAAYRREMRRRHGLILNRRVVKYMLWLAAKQDTRNAAFYKRVPSTPLASMLAALTPPVLPHSSKYWHLSREMTKRTAKFFKDTVRQEQQKERAHQRLVRQLRKGKAPEHGSPAHDNTRDPVPNEFAAHFPLPSPLSSMRFVTQPVSSPTNPFSEPLPTSAHLPPSARSVFGASKCPLFGAPSRTEASLPSHSWSPSENFLRNAFPPSTSQSDPAARPPTPDPFAHKPAFGAPAPASTSTFGSTQFKPRGFVGSSPFVKPFGDAVPPPYATSSGSNVFGATPAPPKYVPSSTFGTSPWSLSRPALPLRDRKPFHNAKFYVNGNAILRANDIEEVVEEIEVEYLVRDAFDTDEDVSALAKGAAQEVGPSNSSVVKRNWEAAVRRSNGLV